MRLLTRADIASFVAEKPAATIHFDANWEAQYRATTRKAMADAEQALADRWHFLRSLKAIPPNQVPGALPEVREGISSIRVSVYSQTDIRTPAP